MKKDLLDARRQAVKTSSSVCERHPTLQIRAVAIYFSNRTQLGQPTACLKEQRSPSLFWSQPFAAEFRWKSCLCSTAAVPLRSLSLDRTRVSCPLRRCGSLPCLCERACLCTRVKESEKSPVYLQQRTVASMLSGPALCPLLNLWAVLLAYRFDPFNQDLHHDRKARVDRACLNKNVSPYIVPAPTRL